MKWTKDKPVIEGFYWMRSHEYSPRIVEVIDNSLDKKGLLNDLYVSFTQGEYDWIAIHPIYTKDQLEGAEWYGPIEIPT